MHNTRLSGIAELFEIETLRLGTTAESLVSEAIGKTAFILATVIDVENAKTEASFMVVWVIDTWLNGGLFNYNSHQLFDLYSRLIGFDFY